MPVVSSLCHLGLLAPRNPHTITYQGDAVEQGPGYCATIIARILWLSCGGMWQGATGMGYVRCQPHPATKGTSGYTQRICCSLPWSPLLTPTFLNLRETAGMPVTGRHIGDCSVSGPERQASTKAVGAVGRPSFVARQALAVAIRHGAR
jgi:hypothetical protein